MNKLEIDFSKSNEYRNENYGPCRKYITKSNIRFFPFFRKLHFNLNWVWGKRSNKKKRFHKTLPSTKVGVKNGEMFVPEWKMPSISNWNSNDLFSKIYTSYMVLCVGSDIKTTFQRKSFASSKSLCVRKKNRLYLKRFRHAHKCIYTPLYMFNSIAHRNVVVLTQLKIVAPHLFWWKSWYAHAAGAAIRSV